MALEGTTELVPGAPVDQRVDERLVIPNAVNALASDGPFFSDLCGVCGVMVPSRLGVIAPCCDRDVECSR